MYFHYADFHFFLILIQPFFNIFIDEMSIKNGYPFSNIILKEIVLDVNKVLVSVDGGTFRRDTTLKWYEKFFTVIKEKADTLKLLIDAGFQAEYLDIVNEIVLRNLDIPVSKKYQRLIWTCGVENAIVYWINGGMRESIEDMAKFCKENLAAWSY